MSDESEEAPRSIRLREARVRRMAEWFEGRRWRVCSEISYETEDLLMRNGEFWTKGDKLFRTEFGNKGRHGYILQEVNTATGQDLWTIRQSHTEPSRARFGWTTIMKASQMYPGSITEVPPRPYGQRGGVSAGMRRRK